MLPILLAFSNSHKDILINPAKKILNETPRGNKAKKPMDDEESNKFLLTEDRVNTANHLLNEIRSKDEKIRNILDSMQQVCEAYIELANTNVQKNKDAITFPKNLLINKIKNFTLVNVLTHNIPIESQTDRLVHIVKFEPTFKLANGVNLPKIVICLGSDGVPRKQLVKGKDDLRQDAVLQQFFETVNKLIQHNHSKNAEKLNPMRTYKIVPLSQKSGVLEWCQNTTTLGDWLTGGDIPGIKKIKDKIFVNIKNFNILGGAHKKYEPNDWAFDECRLKMYETIEQPVKKSKSIKKSKLETYLEICSNFKPVFRYFFMENFLSPNEWFEKRMNYTRSMATASIVGYIVGLGDRHVQNILIDLSNADIIHIDLGVAFEQGKILPIPETIPFRLTRDIVDGFGLSGIEGTFKNCCKKTLELLKSACDQIVTIFEVLLYDPLHNWNLSPEKAYMLQQVASMALSDASNQNINCTPETSSITQSSSLNSSINNTNESTNQSSF